MPRKPVLLPCPVCEFGAVHGGDREDGDKEQVDCNRCGRFEISGTALAMVASRIHQHPLVRARLSHAIRLNTSQNDWFFVSSTNLNELAQKPLPSITQQIQHLVLWIKSRLRDDRFGRTRYPVLDSFAGLVGAVDGERVQRLIDYAVKEGIVEKEETVDRPSLGLSPKGWKMIEEPTEQDKPEPQIAPQTSPKTVKAHCNECGGERSAYKRASHTVNGGDGEVSWSDTYDVLECCGCSSLSVRHTYWFSEWDQFDSDPLTDQPSLIPGIKETYWPPLTKRKKPQWAEKLDDDVIRGVIEEVYQALNAGMIVLASIGTRTLLDRGMFLRVGDPKGGFAAKLNLMVERGHIGKDEREILEAITDAGSAAAHRGFTPNAKTLGTIIETAENFLHREFVLKTAAGEVRTATPPRGPAT
jgi:hypothetical protein